MNNSNLSAKAYQDIKDMLKNLVFPPGALLREQTVADMLGMSRTPIREALQRLAHEGWLQAGDGKRIHVSPVTIIDVNELFQLRFILEPYAAREAYNKGKSRMLAGELDEVLCRMKKVVHDRRVFAGLDMEFHSLIMKHADNDRLCRFWKTLHEETSRAAVMTLPDENDPHESSSRTPRVVEEHAKLLDSFWEKDLGAIMDHMTKHLVNSRNALACKLGAVSEGLPKLERMDRIYEKLDEQMELSRVAYK